MLAETSYICYIITINVFAKNSVIVNINISQILSPVLNPCHNGQEFSISLRSFDIYREPIQVVKSHLEFFLKGTVKSFRMHQSRD